MIAVLAGGVGAARFLQGLVQILDPRELTIISNTGDDIEMWGLHISPDIDIVIYTLAGIVDEEKGWGIKRDSFSCLETLASYGLDTWFQLGDKDLATHILRATLLAQNMTLSDVTRALCKAYELSTRVIPMTDQKFQTMIRTDSGLLNFQEFLVKRKAVDPVREVIYEGSAEALPAPGVLECIMDAESIIIAPSNPIASIGTILSIKGIRESLRRTKATKIAISPIVGGRTLKGPADKMLLGLGLEVSASQIAKLYLDFLDVLVIDKIDQELQDSIEKLGVTGLVTDTVMEGLEGKRRLAEFVLSTVT